MFPDLSVCQDSFTTADDAPAEAVAVVEFWQEAGPDLWFAKDAEFDRLFHARFLSWHEKAAGDELTGWRHSICGALALLVLLDQFPRNAFRGTPHMYVTDLWRALRRRWRWPRDTTGGWRRTCGSSSIYHSPIRRLPRSGALH